MQGFKEKPEEVIGGSGYEERISRIIGGSNIKRRSIK